MVQDTLNAVRLYDKHGGVETANKGDQQGLGLAKRNKQRFEAQQMQVYLEELAPQVLIWTRRWLLLRAPVLQRYGILRLVRDAFGIVGIVVAEAGGVRRITRYEDHSWHGSGSARSRRSSARSR